MPMAYLDNFNNMPWINRWAFMDDDPNSKYWAEIDSNNVVIEVAGGASPPAYSSLNFLPPGTWVQTYRDGSKRKNYAGKGYTYDADRDAFIPPKPATNPSWQLHEETCLWQAPMRYPVDGNDTDRRYQWNEATGQWALNPLF